MYEPQTRASSAGPSRSRASLVPWLALGAAFVLLVPLATRPVDEVALVAGAVMLWLATRSIAYPLGLAGFAAPIVALAGHDPFPPRAVPLIVFAWVVVALVFEARRSGRLLAPGALRSWPFFLTVALAALLLLRLPASTDPSYGNFKVELFVLSNLALFVAGIALGARRERLELYLLLVLAIDVVSGLLVIRQFGSTLTPTDRFGLLDQNVIALGIQGGEGVMIASYLMVRGSTPGRRLAGLVALPVAIVALLSSGSRGPVLGAAAGLLVLLVLLAGSRASALRIAGVIAAFVLCFVAVGRIVPAAASDRALSALTASGGGLSSNGRSQLWSEAWGTMLAHPLGGVGTGSFATRTASLCPGPGCLERYPHNVVLEAGAELGLVGFLLMAAFVLGSGALILRTWRRSSGRGRAELAVVFALFVAAATTALLTGDVSGDGPLWLLAGLGIGLSRLPQARARS